MYFILICAQFYLCQTKIILICRNSSLRVFKFQYHTLLISGIVSSLIFRGPVRPVFVCRGFFPRLSRSFLFLSLPAPRRRGVNLRKPTSGTKGEKPQAPQNHAHIYRGSARLYRLADDRLVRQNARIGAESGSPSLYSRLCPARTDVRRLRKLSARRQAQRHPGHQDARYFGERLRMGADAPSNGQGVDGNRRGRNPLRVCRHFRGHAVCFFRMADVRRVLVVRRRAFRHGALQKTGGGTFCRIAGSRESRPAYGRKQNKARMSALKAEII